MTTKEATDNRSMRFAPIGGYDRIETLWPEFELEISRAIQLKKAVHIRYWKDNETVLDLVPTVYTDDKGDDHISEPARNWIDEIAMKHLQLVFPGVDVLHKDSTTLLVDKKKSSPGYPHKTYKSRKGQFEFEVKDFYESGSFHGSANYRLVHPNNKLTKLAMRSYETKKPHYGVGLSQDKQLWEVDRFKEDNPAKQLHKGLLKDPSHLERSQPFIKYGLVKPGLYKTQERFQQWELMPGDDYIKPGMLREFSLSQFKFCNFEQWRAWERWYIRSKEKYGHSCEEWYLNDDGTLDYQRMISEIYKAIRGGHDKPYEMFREATRGQVHVTHPHHQTLNVLKETVAPS